MTVDGNNHQQYQSAQTNTRISKGRGKHMSAMRTLKDNKGFTLVELAIVLVIIGILLGGVIKGQELIKNAKYKRLYSTYREVVAGVYAYYDKYGKYPGDDNLAPTRGGALWATASAGNGNGYITGTAATVYCPAGSVAAENCYAWQDLRLANLLSGATDAAAGRVAPTHPFGGSVAVINPSGLAGLGTFNTPFAVCFQNLTNETAKWLDATYDDGVSTTGTVRGNGDYIAGYATNPNAIASANTCIEG
jgi:prepilin-type N-terminal cleavage/methylation domain-containing protein